MHVHVGENDARIQILPNSKESHAIQMNRVQKIG
jgi:hypothetical protein